MKSEVAAEQAAVCGGEVTRHEISPGIPATVETLQRKIRKLESQLRIFRKANRGKCLPAKGQTGKHSTRLALVQSVMAAGMAGRTPQRIAADEGVSTTVIYNILAQYGGAIALRKRKA